MTESSDFLGGVHRQIEDRLSAAVELQSRLAEVVGEATSPDGTVQARVGPSGALQDLYLSDKAMDLDPDTLGETILTTTRRAAQRAGEQARELAGPVLGDTGAFDELLSGRMPSLPGEQIEDALRRVRGDRP